MLRNKDTNNESNECTTIKFREVVNYEFMIKRDEPDRIHLIFTQDGDQELEIAVVACNHCVLFDKRSEKESRMKTCEKENYEALRELSAGVPHCIGVKI